MKNTNKIIKGTAALIFAALMVTSFGGCAKSESSTTGGNTSSSAVAESSNTEQPTSVSTATVQRIESKDDEFRYSRSASETTLTIGKYSGNGNVYNIPAEHDGTKVTNISFNGFMKKDVIEVNIPDTITSIGEMAFYSCASLEKVTMGSGVETIDGSAFSDCTALKEITLSDALKEIESYVFMGCTSLEKVTLGANVEKIDETSFAGCTALKEVHMGNSVTYIAGQDVDNPAFKNCNNMTIYAPAGSYAESFAKENNIPFVAE